MPSQGQDKKSGIYGTPLAFLKAVDEVYPIMWDLAASSDNEVFTRVRWWPDYGDNKKRYFDETDNSLSKNWAFDTSNGWLWLNPPFSNIDPWAKKCAEESAKGARILLLVPQGSQAWNIAHCQGKSLELRIIGRMTFEGETAPYPKDLSLFVFGAGITGSGFFNWRK